MELETISADFSVCQLSSLERVDWTRPFVFACRTDEELSLVCEAGYEPAGAARVEEGWRMLRFRGTLDFGQVGVVAALSAVLAWAGISIFVVSTYNTDYVLVKKDVFGQARGELERHGYRVA